MSQTSYSINMSAVAFEGQPVDITEQKDALSVLAVAAALPYGKLVVVDGSNSVGFDKIAGKLPGAAADITTLGSALGVVMADQARAQDPSVALPVIPQNAAASVMRKGRVWVKVEEAVVNGDLAYARYAAGAGGSELGAFRKSADSASAALVPSAVFRSAAASGEFAVLEINLI